MSTPAWFVLLAILIYLAGCAGLIIGYLIGRYTDFNFLDED